METNGSKGRSPMRHIVISTFYGAGRLGDKAIKTEERIPRYIKALLLLGLITGSIILLTIFLQDKNLAILNPEGIVAIQQKRLITVAAVMSLLVVIPVFTMTIYIVWKYRASNENAPYRPDFDHSRVAETIWWSIPILLILVLSVITVKSSHDLDPYKKIASDKQPLTIQVIALDWKWLFIYPDQNIASVNYMRFPVDTPVTLKITSDGPMNSLWIPQLGGQIYAMNGMTTELNLMAIKQGTYAGSSANLSGEGFAGMKFSAEATSESEFLNWVKTTYRVGQVLDTDAYAELAEPSQNNPVTLYYMPIQTLYDTVIMKYMKPNTEYSGDTM